MSKLSLFEERFLDKVAFVLLNAILFGGEAAYIMNKLSKNEKVKLVQHLPDVKMAPAQKQILRKELMKAIENPQPITPKAIPVKPATPPAKPADNFMKNAMEYIKKSEGVYRKLYKDHYGNWTIGIGHLVSPKELNEFRGKTLTDDQIYRIFSNDLEGKISMIKREFPKFDSYPEPLKIVMLDGYFRGDLSGSPLTKSLIKRGLYKQAADEYLDNAEYRREAKRKSGVAKRMFQNASILKQL